MQDFNRVTEQVIKKLPEQKPDYTKADGKFTYREISRVAKNAIQEFLPDGFRVLESQENCRSPKKPGRPVYINNEGQEGTEGMALVGFFYSHEGRKMAVYNTADGFCMAAQEGRVADGCHYRLGGDQILHDGKLVNDKVMQLVIKVGSEYSLGLWLSKTQLTVADEVIGNLWTDDGENNNNGVVVEVVEKKEEVIGEEETVEVEQVIETEQVVKVKQGVETEQGVEPEQGVETEQVVEKGGKTDASQGGYDFYYGLLTGTIAATVLCKLGYMQVPEGVRTWVLNSRQ